MCASQRVRHFGVLSFTGTGHLIPLLALAQELKQRGHRVTFFEKPKVKEQIRQAGFEFVPVGTSSGSARKYDRTEQPGFWTEISTLRFNLHRISEDIEHFLRDTPPAIRRTGVDALIVNEIALTGPTIAQILGLPYFLISTGLPHRFGWGIASWFLGYRYSQSSISWMQSAFLEVSALNMRGPLRSLIDRYRKQCGFGPAREILGEFPPLAHIAQLPACLNPPGEPLPENFHSVGPFVNRAVRSQVAFPWQRLDRRPIVYASLGTTRNALPSVFRMIAEACKDLDVQLILSLGNRLDPADLGDLQGRPLVVRYAPQLELLKMARVVITHGGVNSVLETLLEGKPIIVIPLAYDQPAMAARLARLHVAKVLPVMRLSAGQIRRAVTKVIFDPRYEKAAAQMQTAVSQARGSERAAEVIEASLERSTLFEVRHARPKQAEPIAAN